MEVRHFSLKQKWAASGDRSLGNPAVSLRRPAAFRPLLTKGLACFDVE